MSMTREEAIGALVAAKLVFDFNGIDAPEYTEAMNLAISALTPPTQEQLERVWPGCEKCHNQDNWPSWIEKGYTYCPKCGTPLTSWAWEEMRKRWEALNDGKSNQQR